MSDPSQGIAQGFVPTVAVSHGRSFRSAVDTGEASGGGERSGDGIASGPVSPEEELRAQIERDLNEQMRNQINELQQQVETRLEGFARSFADEREEFRRQLTRAAGELALGVAERVLRREIERDRETILRVVEEAVECTEGARRLRLRVHPDDAEFLREKPQLLADLRVEQVEGDPSIEPGGCILETGERSWDGTVSSQLEQLRERVDEILEGE